MAGDLAASRKNYNAALKIRLAAQGRLHPKVSEDLNQLGTTAYLQGDAKSAEGFWRRSLHLDETVLGPNHPDVAATMNNLARVLIEQRKFREALPLLGRSADIYLAERDETHDDMSFIFANLAIARRGIGEEASAEALFRRALASAEIHDNRLIAPILVDLADLLCVRGQHNEAMRLLDRATPIMRDRYPDDPWRSAWVQNTRGACLIRQRDKTGKAAVAASAPVILEKWPKDSLFGVEVQRRLKLAS
jgi:tetratricopeptide (TPR) repeat protein